VLNMKAQLASSQGSALCCRTVGAELRGLPRCAVSAWCGQVTEVREMGLGTPHPQRVLYRRPVGSPECPVSRLH